ncbi:hypothetical protein [Sedimenticola hydrogenitrophicus]|uniref:hypothetical protein n=1 Tax=Sedimenticola hydrogenitrophicus TaxID=2967975 RepID=UPI0023B01642|nr:hypothetical protein [Sedimenticola hydrogenitrophicus]
MKWFSKEEPRPLSLDEMRKAELAKIRHYDRFILLRIARCGCKTAINHMDQVYPIDQPPQLPLPGCTAPECHCVYEGIVDRRAAKSRRFRAERRKSHRAEDQDERRKNHGRRKGDLLSSYGHF